MRYNITPEQSTIAYSAGQPVTLQVGARSSWLVGVLLTLELAKTDAASPTTYQDWAYRAVTGIQIAGGRRTYVRINNPDTRILYWATRGRLGGRRRVPDLQAGAVTTRHQLPIIFNPNPISADDHISYFDNLVGIRPSDDLAITVTWGAVGAIGANRTIGAGTLMRVHYIEAIPESPAELPRWYPQWFSGVYNPAQTYQNLGGSIAFDTGLWYRRAHLMVLKGASPADVRTSGTAGDAVSEVGLKSSDNRYPLYFRMRDFSELAQGQFHVADDNADVPGAVLAPGIASPASPINPGYGFFDLAKGADPAKVDPVFGTSLVDAPQNALRIGLTVDNIANLAVVTLMEAYGRY